MNIYNYIFHCPSLCPCLCKIIYSPHLILALHRETVHSTNNNHIRGWLSRSAFTIPSQQTWQCLVHKAELEVHEGAKSVTGPNHFHTFIDSQTESLVLSSINKDSRLILSTSVGKRGATSCRWCKNALIEAECLFIICLNWQYFVLFT